MESHHTPGSCVAKTSVCVTRVSNAHEPPGCYGHHPRRRNPHEETMDSPPAIKHDRNIEHNEGKLSTKTNEEDRKVIVRSDRTDSALPARDRTDSALPARDRTDSALPARDRTDSALPARDRTDSALPARDRTDSALPARDRTDSALPARDRTDSP
nr:serine/arginine repetitive matrix protein 2-like [Procambarus clarkii]